MGIHSLNPFLQKKVPRAFRRIPIDKFYKTRIAIDTPLWSYAKFSTAYISFISNEMKNEDMLLDDPFTDDVKDQIRLQVFDRALQFVAQLFRHGITPVFIFDGTAVPEKNSGARERRKQKRDELTTKIQNLKSQILDTDLLIRKSDDYNALRSLLKQLPPVNPGVELPLLKKYIESNLGCPCITSPNEAEKFCAYLAEKGIVSACFTCDTDCYAFGAPIVITSFDLNSSPSAFRNPTHFKCVVTPMILSGLSLTQYQFIDLCILFGCDFNDRIPNIGPEKAWKMISKVLESGTNNNRLIELASVQFPELKWENINAERCREIFINKECCEETLSNLLNNRQFEINKNNVKAELAIESMKEGIDYNSAKNVKLN